jgi:hypothetical protein
MNLVQWPADTMTICEKAVTLPVDEFYISSDAAIDYVRHRYYRGECKQFRSVYKQQLYDALYERFEEVIARPENINKSLPDLVIGVLATPAPCSGLTPWQFYYSLLRYKKENKKK